MRQFFNHTLLAAVALFFSIAAAAQPRTGGVTDTTKSAGNGPGPRGGASTGPKAYKDVITAKAITDRGLFSVHKLDDKYFFEIGDSILGHDIL
ncbi:MAG: DUF5118 domain-containing protein, partial [Chitinophagaceae bacterium]